MIGFSLEDKGYLEESKKARIGRFSDYWDLVRPV